MGLGYPLLERRFIIYIAVALLALLLFVPFLGKVHLFDWDELIFAEAAREMKVSGNYEWIRINYQPFWEKPPLFFWLQATSMHLWGVTEQAARLPNALCGMCSLMLIYYIACKLENKKIALYWVMAHAVSFLPHFYFKTGIIDPWFNLFIFAGIATWAIYFYTPHLKYALLSGISIGLGILTKGPVALLITALCIGLTSLILYRKLNYRKFLLHAFLFLCVSLLPVGLWLGAEIYHNGLWFVRTFWDYQTGLLLNAHSGHSGFFGYHFVVLSIGCFPAVAFLWNGFRGHKKSPFLLIMIILLLLILLIFSIVKTKLVHYSSLAYFPISYLAAIALSKIIQGQTISFYTRLHLWIIGLFWGLLLTTLPILLQYKSLWINNIADPFARGNLNMNVDWHWGMIVWGWGYLGLFSFAMWNLHKEYILRGLLFLGLASLLAIQVILHLWVPKIEQTIQGASIAFWEKRQREDCYVAALYMRSFAPYFYAKVKAHASYQPYGDTEWLLKGAIDKPAYFMCRNVDKWKVLHRAGKDLEFLYEEGGYCFWKRLP